MEFLDSMSHADLCPCMTTLFTAGASLIILYLGWEKITFLFLRLFTTSFQVTGSFQGQCGVDDALYRRLLAWLGKNVKDFQTNKVFIKATISKPDPEEATTVAKDTKETGTETKEVKNEEDPDSEEEFEGDFRQPPDHKWSCRITPTPGYSTHYFLYKNRWVHVKRSIMIPKIHENGHIQEMLTFTTFFWNSYLITSILEEAKPKAKKVDEKKLVVYKATGGYWSRLGGPKKKRPLDTIILNGNVMSTLLNDIRSFLSLEDWYIERGIPYRRGYLLYGPPGCGKSSVIKALAGEIGFDICVFSLSQQLTDDSMSELMNQAPTKSIILLEDIDAAFRSRETKESQHPLESQSNTKESNNLAFDGCSQSQLTFRGLLNALDGVGSAEDGLLVFMTTNYPERLDPALIRPGRVDLKMNIDYPNDLQLEAMFQRFYPEEEEETRMEFVKEMRTFDFKVSMAMVQGLMLFYRENPKEAIKNAKDHFSTQFCNLGSSSSSTCSAAENFKGLYC